jgi:acetylornithine deacetylase/succinyl-diaminopimelate desuccinylase-like protein
MRSALFTIPLALVAVAPAFAVEDTAKEARALVDELVAIDTSNPPGNEERAAKAIAAHLKAAGIESQLLPFAPGRANLVARLKGDGTKKPLLLMAHLDVVGAAGQPWTMPPFRVTEKDGWLYGRGISDDKSWAAMMTALAIELHKSHAKLHRDLILMYNGDEESGGAGVRDVIAHHKELIADAEFALNEGGGITLDDAGKPRVVSLGTAEKTFQNFTLTARGTGGHSSVPNEDNAIYHLARALQKLAAFNFPTRLTPTLRETLRATAVTQPPARAQALRAAADTKGDAIPAALLPAIDDFPYTRALTRTTCVATMTSGGTRDNALPVEAKANVNCRIMPVDSIDWVQKELATIVGPEIDVARVSDYGVGPDVPVRGPVRDAVEKAAHEVLGRDVTVVARIGLGASDSRFVRQIGILAYGVGLLGKPEELKRSPHGPDEAVPAASFPVGVTFLRALVSELAQ